MPSSWRLGIIMPLVETGLYNLTNDEASVLVHFGKDQTESLVFVRLKQPDEGAAKG